MSGTAGTGKSFLINCLRLLLSDKLRVAAPTGVAAFNVDGGTLHSLLSLPTKGEFKELEGERLHKFQQSLADMKYLIIDEMSMVGRKMFGQIDKRLRQVFPHHSDQVLGGCSCLLFGDFGQLPPVMDRVYEFAGLEPRIGLLEWTTGVDYWISGLLDCMTFEPETGNRAHNYY